jgi:hypothetical protein
VVLGGLAPGRAPLLLLPRAVPHRSSQPESERERRGRAGVAVARRSKRTAVRRKAMGVERGDLRWRGRGVGRAGFCRAGLGWMGWGRVD